MALPSTMYRATITLADIDRNHYETLRVTLARHPSETAERLAVRLLAYVLNHQEGLAFGRGIGAGDEPELWLKDGDGRVRLWIDVGLPDPERLIKASRHAGRVVLLAYGTALPHWVRQHLPRLQELSNLEVAAVPQDLLVRLVPMLQRTLNWSVTITGGMLYLETGGVTLEAEVERLVGLGS